MYKCVKHLYLYKNPPAQKAFVVEWQGSASEVRLMIASHSRFCYAYIYICLHCMQAGATVAQA